MSTHLLVRTAHRRCRGCQYGGTRGANLGRVRAWKGEGRCIHRTVAPKVVLARAEAVAVAAAPAEEERRGPRAEQERTVNYPGTS